MAFDGLNRVKIFFLYSQPHCLFRCKDNGALLKFAFKNNGRKLF